MDLNHLALLRELAERAGVRLHAYDLAERLDVGLPDVRALIGEEADGLDGLFTRSV